MNGSGVVGWDCLDLAEDNEDGNKYAGYIRVSSMGQSRTGALENQRQILIDEICKRENCHPSDITIYSDVASSFGKRKGLDSLIQNVISGKHSRIYATYRDRWARTKSLSSVLSSILSSAGCTLTFCFNEECDNSEVDNSYLELVEFCTVLGAKQAGAKAGRLSKKGLSQDCIRRGAELLAIHPVSVVCDILNQEGYTAENAKGRGKISRHVVEMIILKPLEMNKKATQPRTLPNSFELFHEERLSKGSTKSRLRKKVLYENYVSWLQLTHPNERAFSAKRVGQILVKKGYERKHTRNGCIAYVGIVLNGQK